ncbi:MAG: UbiD family decarboxylase [Firmicutes bacterium]|nr:UbiD family decarboxylase [Bacillota bacterium]
MKDLRSFLKELEKIYPDEIKYCNDKINPYKYEASAVMESFDRENLYPLVSFTNIVNLKGEETDFNLLFNAFSTMEKLAVAVNVDQPRRPLIMEKYYQGSLHPKPVKRISSGAAPVKEIVWSGEGNVDMNRLPLPRINEMDGGPYLTPIIATRDADNDRYNISWNRAMMIDKNHLGLWMSPRHLWSIFSKYEQRGTPLPIAVVLGHHPAFFLAGAGLTKISQDEYEVAGGVLGENLRVVESETFGEELLVPADAEIILEGLILPDQRSVEGPFGEFTGYSGPQRISWLVEIKAITARKGGSIISVFGAHQDNLYAHMPIQADIFHNLKTIMPTVQDISWVDSGGPLNLIISMDKKTEGEPIRVAMAAMSLSNFIKHVIVVDEDIDPGNLKQVMWAWSTRVQADKDINIIKRTQGQVLDPSLTEEIAGSAMIIDATKPIGPYAVKAQPPEEIVKSALVKKVFEGLQ